MAQVLSVPVPVPFEGTGTGTYWVSQYPSRVLSTLGTGTEITSCFAQFQFQYPLEGTEFQGTTQTGKLTTQK